MKYAALAVTALALTVAVDAQRTYRIGIITFAGTPTHRLPMVGCCQVSIARGGGLASYSPPNGWPAMAERIDFILKGNARPEDMPILRSSASPLTLNLQEAQQIIR